MGEKKDEEKEEVISLTGESDDVKNLKWFVLGLSSFVLFSSYYTVDVPAAVHDREKTHFASSKEMDFELFFGLQYSLYSVPNIFLPFFGGYLVSRFGASKMILAFSGLLLAGQLLVVLGIATKLMFVVLLGRVLFGAGSESLCVAVSALLATWFAGSNVALAMGLSLSISRLGSVVNDVLSNLVAHALGLVTAFILAAGLLGIALFAAHALYLIDSKQSSSLVETEDNNSSKTSWKAVFGWPAAFYWLTLSCVTVYGVVIPWNSVSSSVLIERECGGECCPDGVLSCDAHLAAERKASALMTIPFAISGVAVPFLGYAIDRFGGRGVLALASSLSLVLVHSLFAWTPFWFSSIPMLVIQGCAYAVYAAALWPSVPLIIPEKQVGLAYGVITSVQNLGLSLVPLGVAGLRSMTNSYHGVEILFMSLALLGAVAGVAINWLDSSQMDHVLNRTTLATSKKGGDLSLKEGSVRDVTSNAEKLVQYHSINHDNVEAEPLLSANH